MQTANEAARTDAAVYEAGHSESVSDSESRKTCVINCGSSCNQVHLYVTSDRTFGWTKSGPLSTQSGEQPQRRNYGKPPWLKLGKNCVRS